MPGEDKSKISDPKDVAVKIVNYILKEAGTGEIIEITWYKDSLKFWNHTKLVHHQVWNSF